MISFRHFKSNRSRLISALRFPKKPAYAQFCEQESFHSTFSTYSRELLYKVFSEFPSSRNEVLIPNYMCNTLVDAIVSANAQVKFYPLSLENDFKSLAYLEMVILKNLTPQTAAVVIVDFFGVPQSTSKVFRDTLRSAGVMLIRDASHAYLTLVHQKFQGVEDYDATFTSLYKSMPSNVGGLLLSKKKSYSDAISFWEFLKLFIRALLIELVLSFWNALIERDYTKLRSRPPSKIPMSRGFLQKIFASIFRMFLWCVDENALVRRRRKNAEEIYQMLAKVENTFVSNLYTWEQVNSSVFMAYPVLFANRELRDAMCVQLQSLGIDVYTWPVFSELNISGEIWGRILLLPVSRSMGTFLEFALQSLQWPKESLHREVQNELARVEVNS